MVMIFTLVSAAQEYMLNIIDEMKREIEDERRRAIMEQQKLDEIKVRIIV